MVTSDPIEEGRAAAERVEVRAAEGTQRWGWVRLFAIVSLVGLGLAVLFGVIGVLTTRDVQNAVTTSRFSEEQRRARSLRADCIRDYEIDREIASSRFDRAIVGYLAFDQGSIVEALELADGLDRAIVNLERVKAGTLCTTEEFGVIDDSKEK